MKSKKRLLFAGVVAAIAVLAVPAMASAAVWKHNGSNLTKFVELGLTGGEVFETSSGNGMQCNLHATLVTEGGSTGEITEYETESCGNGVGAFANCQLNTQEAIGLPWEVEVNTTDLTIVEWHVKRTFNGTGCTAGEVNKTIAEVTVELTTPSAISEMEFEGETTGYEMFGSFEVEGGNNGTYGIG